MNKKEKEIIELRKIANEALADFCKVKTERKLEKAKKQEKKGLLFLSDLRFSVLTCFFEAKEARESILNASELVFPPSKKSSARGLKKSADKQKEQEGRVGSIGASVKEEMKMTEMKRKEKPKDRCFLLNLPKDLFLLVLQHVDAADLRSFACTNKHFFNLICHSTSTERVWEAASRRMWERLPRNVNSWKYMYKIMSTWVSCIFGLVFFLFDVQNSLFAADGYWFCFD